MGMVGHHFCLSCYGSFVGIDDEGRVFVENYEGVRVCVEKGFVVGTVRYLEPINHGVCEVVLCWCCQGWGTNELGSGRVLILRE